MKFANAYLYKSNSYFGVYDAINKLVSKERCLGNTGCGTCKKCKIVSLTLHKAFRALLHDNDCEVCNSELADLYIESIVKLKTGSEEGGKKEDQIDIKSVHDLITKIQLVPHIDCKRFVIIVGNTMSSDAQNHLLKSLEEPPGSTVFLLFIKQLNTVLSTVVSRCQQIPLFSKRVCGDLLAHLENEYGDNSILIKQHMNKINQFSQLIDEVRFDSILEIVDAAKITEVQRDLASLLLSIIEYKHKEMLYENNDLVTELISCRKKIELNLNPKLVILKLFTRIASLKPV